MHLCLCVPNAYTLSVQQKLWNNTHTNTKKELSPPPNSTSPSSPSSQSLPKYEFVGPYTCTSHICITRVWLCGSCISEIIRTIDYTTDYTIDYFLTVCYSQTLKCIAITYRVHPTPTCILRVLEIRWMLYPLPMKLCPITNYFGVWVTSQSPWTIGQREAMENGKCSFHLCSICCRNYCC